MGQDESWFSAAEHFASAAVEGVGHLAETAAEDTVHAFEAAGSTAEEAASMVAPELQDLPVVGAVISGGEVLYHAGAAVVDGVEGDWDGAANQSLSMSESAANVATVGLLGAAEGAWDLGNAAGGGDEHSTAHGWIHQGLEATGNALGDAAYDAVQYVEGNSQ